MASSRIRDRQIGDGLERLGGVDRRLDGEMRLLARNLKRNAAESENIGRKLESLQKRLANIDNQLEAD